LATAPTGNEGGPDPQDSSTNARLWPSLIIVGLIFVILVNAIFIYIAVSGADDVVPSYFTEER